MIGPDRRVSFYQALPFEFAVREVLDDPNAFCTDAPCNKALILGDRVAFAKSARAMEEIDSILRGMEIAQNEESRMNPNIELLSRRVKRYSRRK